MKTKPVKYTTAFVLKEVRGLLKTLRADNKQKPSFIFLQDLVEDKDYTRKRVWEWRNFEPSKTELEALELTQPDEKLKESIAEISDTLKKIEEILEGRLIKVGLLKGGAMPIFLLKTIYGHVDRVDVTTKGEKLPEGKAADYYVLPDGTKVTF